MKLITLSGVDGSGKSTQLTRLKEKLERDGKKVFYFHAIEFSLASRLARLSNNKKEFVAGSEKAIIQASWLSLQLRKLFLLVDIFRFKALMRKLASAHYDYILSDRYFYDSVINILYLSKNTHSLYSEQFIPRPDHALYFQVTAEAIMKRSRVPEQGIDYLKDKITLFEQKKDAFRLLPIDASETQDHIFTSLIADQNIFLA